MSVSREPLHLPPRPAARHAGPQVHTDDGRVVLRKEATDPIHMARLTREARVLTLARHPGVVPLLDLQVEPDRVRLTTAFTGTHTLATWPCRSAEHAAGLVAALAETVADLHQLGLIHGRIRADHVLVDGEGRPVLTGFAEAACAAVGDTGPDPSDPGTPAPTPADDVHALGRLLHDLAAAQADGAGLVPERRWRRHHDAAERRSLLNLADHATADDPTARPGARRLAAAILAAVPDATLGPASDPAPGPGAPHRTARDDASSLDPAPVLPLTTVAGHHDPDEDRPRPRRGLPLALALVGLVLGGFGLAGFATGPRPDLASPAAPAAHDPTAAGPTPTDSAQAAPPGDGAHPAANPPTTSPAVPNAPGPADPTSVPPGTVATEAVPTASDVGEACPPASGSDAPAGRDPCTQVVAGGIVNHLGRRYAVGDPGDEVAITPATCPATADVLAVLRPRTGEVFVFTAWADLGHDTTAPASARVAPDSHWVTRASRGGCAPLVARQPDGTLVPVPVPVPRSTP